MKGHTSRVELRLFGEWRLLVDGQRAEVGRAQVRSLLAVLAVADRGLRADELIEQLWGDRLPADPRRALRVVVSRCRTALGPAADELATVDGNFSLNARSDVATFVQLTDRADDLSPSDRADALGEALALWDGSALAELDHVALTARLARRREAAQSRYISTLAELGRHADVVMAASEPHADAPHDQGLTEALTRALAAIGRKSGALEVLQRSRTAQRRLGLDLADELHDLEQQVLDGAVDLAPRRPAPTTHILLGRERELDLLASVPMGEMMMVVAEAGIGKSALLTTAANRLRETGHKVRWVRGRRGGARVMEPIAELVARDLTAAEPLSEHERQAVAVIAPEADSNVGPWTNDRRRLIETLSDVVARIVDGEVLVVDDVHDLDAMSVGVVEGVLQRRSCHVVGGARPYDNLPFPDARRIVLEPLDEPVINDWVTKVLGVDALDARTLHRRTGGNALFVRLLLDAAKDEQPTDAELPGTILAAVSAMVDRAGPEGRRALDAAAVLAPVEIDIVTELTGVDTDEIGRLVDLGLLRPFDGDDPVLAFSHDLVAEACAQLQGQGVRLAVSDAAAALHTERGSSPLAGWRHAVAAELVDPTRAFEGARAAAFEYAERLAWEQGREAAQAAIAISERAGFDAPTNRLAGIVAQAMILAGEKGGDEQLATAADAAIATGDADTAVELTARLAGRGTYALLGLDVDLMLGRIQAALALDTTPSMRARLQAAACRALAYSPHHEVGQRIFRDAIARLDEIDDPAARAAVLRQGFQGASHPDDLELSERLGALLEAEQADSPEVPWIGPWIRFRNALRRADGATLAQARADAAAAAGELNTGVWAPVTVSIPMQQMWVDASFHIAMGEPDEAERLVDDSLVLFEELYAQRSDQIGRGWAMNGSGSLRVAIRSQQGRLAELAPQLARSTSRMNLSRASTAAALHAARSPDKAVAILRELSTDGFSALLPDLSYTGAVWLLAAPTADLLGADACRALYARIDRYRDQLSSNSMTTFGPMHEALAVLADAIGQDQTARDHRTAAAELMAAFRTAVDGHATGLT